jgi:hypothetical protein
VSRVVLFVALVVLSVSAMLAIRHATGRDSGPPSVHRLVAGPAVGGRVVAGGDSGGWFVPTARLDPSQVVDRER